MALMVMFWLYFVQTFRRIKITLKSLFIPKTMKIKLKININYFIGWLDMVGGLVWSGRVSFLF